MLNLGENELYNRIQTSSGEPRRRMARWAWLRSGSVAADAKPYVRLSYTLQYTAHQRQIGDEISMLTYAIVSCSQGLAAPRHLLIGDAH